MRVRLACAPLRFPLIDLRLFKNRTFATSSISLILVCISVFGAFLLLPLYFQTVRGQSPLMSGVLLAPNGFGAMLAMPVAGMLSDRMGPGRIVPFGLLGVILSVLWLTQIGAHTSFALLSVDLFIFGIGLGFTMMPVYTGAMQAIRGPAVARASTALNILQQTGSSIGTAVLTVLLASALKSEVGGSGTIGATVPQAKLDKLASPMASAFGQTFWWAFGLLVIAFVGSLMLPRGKPDLSDEEEAGAAQALMV